jgi:hypothetical protein
MIPHGISCFGPDILLSAEELVISKGKGACHLGSTGSLPLTPSEHTHSPDAPITRTKDMKSKHQARKFDSKESIPLRLSARGSI